MREELEPISSDDPETAACSICHMLYDLGDKLPDAKFIDRKPANENDISSDVLMFSMADVPASYRLFDSFRELNDDYSLVYVINSWNLEDYLYANSVQRRSF